MRVVYYADDGREFETEKECREYEKKTANFLNEFENSIYAYNCDGEPVSLKDYDPEEWEYPIEKISYIQFNSQKAIDVFMDYVVPEFGMVDIASDINREVKVGERYFYDYDEGVWCCLENKQKALDEIANVFTDK